MKRRKEKALRLEWLDGDTNWEEHGGRFFCQDETHKDCFHVLAVEPVGEREWFLSVREVWIPRTETGAIDRAAAAEALAYYGIDEKDDLAEFVRTDDPRAVLLLLVSAMSAYGQGDSVAQLESNNLKEAMREGREAIATGGLWL